MDSTHPELEFSIVAISYPLRRPPVTGVRIQNDPDGRQARPSQTLYIQPVPGCAVPRVCPAGNPAGSVHPQNSALPHVAPLSFPSPENKVRHADR
ncbi:hypothetical protein ACMVI2_001093 [Salmonella enterica]